MDAPEKALPRRRRLGFRIAAWVSVVFIGIELSVLPLFIALDRSQNPELYETGEGWPTSARIGYAIFITVYSVLIGTIMAFVVSRVATRRLSRLEQAARTVDGAALPPEFPVEGGDEIARLATAMNAMRARVASLVEDLAARDELRREWIAQVSHDLRTPLAACAISLDHARQVANEGHGELTELLAAARIDAARVQALADDLLEIARLEADDPLVREPITPRELALRTVRGLTPLANERGVDIEARVPLELPTVEADGRRLARALENLVLNGVQHAASKVAVVVERLAGALRFRVEDDGAGLPDGAGYDDLERTRSRADSAGLGLRVTRRVAEAHGGRVGANATSGGGAVVWFEVPFEPA